MKFYLVAFSAAAAFLLWTSWYSGSAVLASSGFTGSWCGNSRYAYMITDFPRLVVKQGTSEVTSAHYNLNGAQLVAERWAQTGTLSANGSKIHWSDGSVWERAIYGTQLCATFAAMSAPPPPPSYRLLQGFGGRSFPSRARAGPGAPIVLVDSWTAIMNNEARGVTCVSFKNASGTATRVVFGLKLIDQNEHVFDTGDLARTGTFSPNVEIHGNTVAEWWNNRGNRETIKNCTGWRPDNEAQRLGYRHARYYDIGIDRIEYADGTTWTSPLESPSSSPAP